MNILIADDHALFRDGLILCLEKIAPNAKIFQVANYRDAEKSLEKDNIDLIILDLSMPDMGWKQGVDSFHKIAPKTRILIVSASEDCKDIRQSMEYGVCGYITKTADTKTLSNALKLVLDGGTYLPPELLNCAYIPVVKEGSNLTARQKEVLECMARGLSNKQIAYEMNIAEATVKLHINALLKVLGATNRTQAVVNAQKTGII